MTTTREKLEHDRMIISQQKYEHDVTECYPDVIQDKYEIYSYNHAQEIMAVAYPQEINELVDALAGFEFSIGDVSVGGGSESAIPKKFDALLYGLNWREASITGDLTVHVVERWNRYSRSAHGDMDFENEVYIPGFLSGYNIDFLKGRIACDVEWNSKDQTFDRDLYSMRGFYEAGIISVGIIITRSSELQDFFRSIGQGKKYGASTTHMNKLLVRLATRRAGGCPILAIGIKEGCCRG